MPLAGALKDKNSIHTTDSQRGSQAKARPARSVTMSPRPFHRATERPSSCAPVDYPHSETAVESGPRRGFLAD